VTPDGQIVLEIFGEGKTDIGEGSGPDRPTKGVVSILVHTLCGRPGHMLVKPKRYAQLQKGDLQRKVGFARRQVFYNRSDGAVFVVDSEGGDPELKEKSRELERGRDSARVEIPMAVGVAHPCIEAWLLADAAAVRRACGLPQDPEVPAEPERLPAPRQDERRSPKAALAHAVGARQELPSDRLWKIARELRQLDLVRQRCPRGFAPFADDVEQRIAPLFF
jgi:hypothetical protein